MIEHQPSAPANGFEPRAITRPDPVLLRYYVICALLTGPLCVIVIWPMLFKYHTLRYRFDDEGIAASWGILWRHEVYLTYRRIQDIHVSRGLIQRWLGLAGIAVQTASGSATPELTIDGVLQYDALRNFLYEQMRGAKSQAGATRIGTTVAPAAHLASSTGPTVALATDHAADDEALKLLRQIRDELALVRTKLERREVQADGSVGGGGGRTPGTAGPAGGGGGGA